MSRFTTHRRWQNGRSRRTDIPFYLEEAKIAGGPILELGCGTGRLLVPLLSTGYDVYGLDVSVAMLEVITRKCQQLPNDAANRLHLHQGDMREFELGQQFAFVVIAFRSFQHLLTPEDQRRCLICVRNHLAPNGKAIIDLFDPCFDLIQPGMQESVWPPKDMVHPDSGNHVLVEILERLNDPVSQTFTQRWRFTEADSNGQVIRQEEEQLHARWTFRYEMRYLVENCGFAVEAEYSDFQRSPPTYGKEQVWVLRKTATQG